MSRKGYIQDFEKQVKFLKSRNKTFSVEMAGMTRIIYYHDADGNVTSKNIYYGHKGMPRMEGVELVNLLRKELRKRIENGEKAPKYTQGSSVLGFHIPNLKRISEAKEEIIEIDMNACYWTTAYRLGFISDELFQKGWKKRRTAKIGLLAAIGSLNKKTYTEDFSFGKSGGIERCAKDDMFRPYYWAVITEVNRIMHESIKKIPPHHFMMWLTDCIYLKKESAPLVKDYFKELGYEFKQHTSHIDAVSDRTIKWTCHKDNSNKYVFYSDRERIK